MKKIGFTTSFPIEVTFAAGITAVDLNNIFVMGESKKFVEHAEFNGFPRNICSWIKGMYGVALNSENFDAILGIVQGDCSTTHSLMETIQDEDLAVIPFSYPFKPSDAKFLDLEIKKLENLFNVSRKQTNEAKKYLDNIRKKLITLDKFTWKEGKVSGLENHLWLVNSSDFERNPEDFEMRLDSFLEEVKQRDPFKVDYRYAYLGVPPIIPDLYDYFLEHKVNIVFNEVQRQFSMPFETNDIVEQYQFFTYPYSVFYRIKDITKEIEKRDLDGVINYSQAFCHRQIDQITFKKHLAYPFLNLEGDEPTSLDERTKLRIESFIDMMKY